MLATEGANSHKRSGTQDCDSKTFAIWRAVLRHPPKEQAGHTYVSGQTLRYRGQGGGAQTFTGALCAYDCLSYCYYR